MTRFLMVCLGGAFGTGARYLFGGWAQRILGTAFPYGTLIVNMIGSFLLAVIMYLSLEVGLIPANTRMVLATGVMGGFTTYSTFNYETLKLLQTGSVAIGALNIAGTVAGCLVAGLLGLVVAKALT